ncbi:sepiapterin reductase [Scaptodrosophila lebanonensis]|uniref:Sepiapterin reductase n=1 Tax=Drosophila lebanonensis TaxID=7225 RepID=A0A6J2U4Y1_DROLE|nr:sepiapterin reductase [Scaptodrosophila lebanonensis]
MNYLQDRTFLLVTGASRGIGREMALQLSKQMQTEGSLVVLLGRSQQHLDETKTAIEQARGTDNVKLKVLSYTLELATATATDFAELLKQSLQGVDIETFKRAIVIHNAGTVGDISLHAREIGDTKELTHYYHINFFSTVALNCEFMRVFRQLPKLIVNLSTKAAVEPFASMAYYCTVKAARDMYFRVLAVEEPSEQTLVLNYAPGAIDTQMTEQVQRDTHNQELAAAFRQQRESKTMLTTEQTVLKFLNVLQAQKFKSGDHVDYWD